MNEIFNEARDQLTKIKSTSKIFNEDEGIDEIPEKDQWKETPDTEKLRTIKNFAKDVKKEYNFLAEGEWKTFIHILTKLK